MAAARQSDIARNCDLIPRPAKMLETPWPPKQADTLDAIQQVALPTPAQRKPWMLYGMAAAGLVGRGAGLAVRPARR